MNVLHTLYLIVRDDLRGAQGQEAAHISLLFPQALQDLMQIYFYCTIKGFMDTHSLAVVHSFTLIVMS